MTGAQAIAPELVIFDCDGVLVDSEPLANTVLAAAISQAGHALTPEESRRRYQGRHLADVSADVERRLGGPLPADFWPRFERDREVAFRESLHAVPGAPDTIAAVQRAGLRTCVASQGSLAKTELTLGLTGLRGFFADGELFSADDVTRGKPFPDLFLHAAARMGGAPDRSVVVEDSATGLRAAAAAGMTAVAYVAPGRPDPRDDDATPVIEALPELLDLIGVSD